MTFLFITGVGFN